MIGRWDREAGSEQRDACSFLLIKNCIFSVNSLYYMRGIANCQVHGGVEVEQIFTN